MKIKNLIVAFVAAMILAACATSGSSPVSVAQGLSIVCAQFNVASPMLESFNAVLVANPTTNKIGVKATGDLAKAQAPITAMCAAGATVTSTQLLTAVQQALPAFALVIAEIPLPPSQQTQIQGALIVAEGAVGLVGIVEQQIQAAKAAPVAPVAK